MPSERPTGYIKLIKDNPSFRNLWYGQIVSELGDWLNSIAIFALVLTLTGSGLAMAATMVAKLLPIVMVTPVAGVVVDRFNRRTVMIASDIIRFVIVLGFLLVHTAQDLWLLFALVVLEISMAGFFEPARSAIIPSLIQRQHLVSANALSGATWSVMLALGAALGGVVVSLFGIQTAFILDALTFLVSAFFIARIPLEKGTLPGRSQQKGGSGLQDFTDGCRYLFSEPVVLAITLVKSGLAVAGGIMTLIPLYATEILDSPAAISMGIGILYSARGLGAALGPILVTRSFGDASSVLQNAIAFAFFLAAVSFLGMGYSESLLTASVSIGLGTLFGSVIWVFSSSLIHLEADTRFHGRIFSIELGILTLVMAGSNAVIGAAIDLLGVSPYQASRWIAGSLVIPGLLWVGMICFVKNRLRKGQAVGSFTPARPGGFAAPQREPFRND